MRRGDSGWRLLLVLLIRVYRAVIEPCFPCRFRSTSARLHFRTVFPEPFFFIDQCPSALSNRVTPSRFFIDQCPSALSNRVTPSSFFFFFFSSISAYQHYRTVFPQAVTLNPPPPPEEQLPRGQRDEKREQQNWNLRRFQC